MSNSAGDSDGATQLEGASDGTRIGNVGDSFKANVTNFPATQVISGTVSISGTVPVSGTFWQTTQPVSGTFWQATQPVSAASLPLPTGASTSALQTTGNTSLSSIDTKTPALVSGRVPVDGSGVTQPVSGTFWQTTQPVSAASLPLPTGAATSALQTTGNTSLASIDGKLPALVSGRIPVDGSGVTQPVDLTKVGGTAVSLGQKVAASSIPVVLASDVNVTVKQEPNVQIAAGNGYAIVLVNQTVGTTETKVLYLKNNSGSKTVYIFNTFLTQDVANANNYVNFRLYYNPTVTVNGTAATIVNLLAGSANASACNGFTGPTTSGGTLVKFWPSGLNNAAAAVQDVLFPNYFILPPGQSLLVTGISKANSQGMNVLLNWFEV